MLIVNNNFFINIIINFGIWVAPILPLLIYFFIKEKKHPPRMVRVDFYNNGQKISKEVKMGFSWTVAFFKWLALFFRFQFIEGLISLSVYFITAIILFLLSKTSYNSTTIRIIFWAICQFFATTIIYYYAIKANKLLLKKLYEQGCTFNNNFNVEEIYKYIGVVPEDQEELVSGDVVKGEKHKYVVPDKRSENNKNESEDEDDYSSLTIQDLKLLLRSEGVSFDNSLSKEELLNLVDKHISKKEK